MRKASQWTLGVITGLVVAAAGSVLAGTVELPFIFTPQTEARASEVNANFASLASAVNDSAADIADLQGLVGSEGGSPFAQVFVVKGDGDAADNGAALLQAASAASVAASSGKRAAIFLEPGHYQLAGFGLAHGIALIGAGELVTHIHTTSESGYGHINLSGGGSNELRNLTLEGSITSSVGELVLDHVRVVADRTAVSFSAGATRVTLRDVDIKVQVTSAEHTQVRGIWAVPASINVSAHDLSVFVSAPPSVAATGIAIDQGALTLDGATLMVQSASTFNTGLAVASTARADVTNAKIIAFDTGAVAVQTASTTSTLVRNSYLQALSGTAWSQSGGNAQLLFSQVHGGLSRASGILVCNYNVNDFGAAQACP